MKNFNVFLLLQIVILGVFLTMFCFSAYKVMTMAEPPDNITSLFNEMKTLFLGLLSWETLKKAIATANGADITTTVTDTTISKQSQTTATGQPPQPDMVIPQDK